MKKYVVAVLVVVLAQLTGCASTSYYDGRAMQEQAARHSFEGAVGFLKQAADPETAPSPYGRCRLSPYTMRANVSSAEGQQWDGSVMLTCDEAVAREAGVNIYRAQRNGAGGAR